MLHISNRNDFKNHSGFLKLTITRYYAISFLISSKNSNSERGINFLAISNRLYISVRTSSSNFSSLKNNDFC